MTHVSLESIFGRGGGQRRAGKEYEMTPMVLWAFLTEKGGRKEQVKSKE